ncbi:unnamed protein product [Closterium sp. NIES-64]|nr:unnamed protein product [Closterium sp. NIES-64]CAI5999445.1 unnamed protein product [Closterium sp. NIES-65]CAI6002623.1 unnamed protein product [Closterium sp. NIES-65]
MSSSTAISHVSATLASLRLASTNARVQSFRQSSFVRSAALKQRLGANVAAGSRVSAWFKFGKNGLDAESSGIYGSQGRDDFDRDDVEHYYNYMGMLAVEGTYDKMEKLLNTGIHPVDLLLMMAASEGDRPKIQELLRAGANGNVKDMDGRTALDRAADDEIRQLIADGAEQLA